MNNDIASCNVAASIFYGCVLLRGHQKNITLTSQLIRATKRHIERGMVNRLTTNLNPSKKGDAMERLLKPRISEEKMGFYIFYAFREDALTCYIRRWRD